MGRAAHFTAFLDQAATTTGRWIHVACSIFHDVEPAHSLGVRTIYVDRGQEPNGIETPTARLSDLSGIVEVANAIFSESGSSAK